MRIAAIVLAAGASRRLGKPKQLIRLNGEMLVERAVRICREAGCDPVITVLGAAAEQIREQCSFDAAKVFFNREWNEGMGASVRTGVSALEADVDGCVIVTCDMPAVSVEHLRKLMQTGEQTASLYAGRHGVPAYFPRSMFPRLINMQGDMGARELLKEARGVELVGGELDVDTPEDIERMRKLFQAGGSVS